MAYVLFSASLLLCVVFSTEHPYSTSSHNFTDSSIQKLYRWKSANDFLEVTKSSYNKNFLGTLKNISILEHLVKIHESDMKVNLPDSFDSRDKWYDCLTLNEISDQGACGGCWVFSAVEAIRDRYCTYSNGTKQFYFSAEDVLTCSGCGDCQDGGVLMCVYQYWNINGIVSGGRYNSNQGCRPYEIPTCELHEQGIPCTEYGPTPKCVRSCRQGYNKSYEEDRRYASKVYSLEGEELMKRELFLNGPVTASMIVYEDFITYKSGVYRYTNGKSLGGHAVRLLGWGEEKGLKYWLAANSWNVEWGEKGFFKILRGENHCDIEGLVITGIPLYPTDD